MSNSPIRTQRGSKRAAISDYKTVITFLPSPGFNDIGPGQEGGRLGGFSDIGCSTVFGSSSPSEFLDGRLLQHAAADR